MTKIYFIRHAETDYSNRDDMLRPLTDSGEKSAREIPALFDGIQIDHFYSSTYIRAINTIRHLADQREMKISLCPDLRERETGAWIDDFLEYAEKQWDDFDYKVGEGESLREAQQRNIAEINNILEKHPNRNIVIGTHGTAICTIFNHYDNQIHFSYFKSVVDKKPFFVEALFDGMDFISMKELFTE